VLKKTNASKGFSLRQPFPPFPLCLRRPEEKKVEIGEREKKKRKTKKKNEKRKTRIHVYAKIKRKMKDR